MQKALILIFLFIFPAVHARRSFNIVDYGADKSGKTVCTASIQEAIDECAASGGGTVFFPAGKYISGTLFLRSFVSLYLENGAVLKGSSSPDDYPLTIPAIRSYTDNYTNKSLIYAENQAHITIEGNGTIDGSGGAFRVTAELKKADLHASYKMRPYIMRIVNCENVAVRNINITDSPMWVQHYLHSKNITIEGITVRSTVNENNDGIDIDDCEMVRISDCNIRSGDDAIVLKSTSGGACRNIVVTNCILSSNCNAFKLGTETNGDFSNISFTSSVIYNTRLAGIAVEMVDGGTMNNINVSGVQIDTVGAPVFIRLGNRARPVSAGSPRPGTGKMSGIMICNIQARNAGKTGCAVSGIPGSSIEDITLKDIHISFAGGKGKNPDSHVPEELPDKYPEYSMFGDLPAYGFYLRHIKGIVMDDLRLSFNSPDNRPALLLDDVSGGHIGSLEASNGPGIPSIIIMNSRDVNVDGRKAANGETVKIK